MSNSIRENLLLIFVKNPEPGQVKTRLAESIGEGKALRVYQQLLQVTKSVTDQLNCTRQVWYTSFIDDKDLWAAGEYDKRLQSGNDLGERMKNAFREGFAEGYQKVVIIGSDCAELSPSIIEKAFRAMDEHDIVIGPSEDGGYYLLGMRKLHPQLFEDLTWSTPSVYEDTLARIEESELKYENLPVLNDIDTEQDLILSDVI